ncbi:hypothetical protein EB796_006445 [Bugula neritina]|uniref:Uncharacterized protein n=1 Tax=Bugula neritina TaxID=10212 RepID=A0A7J7KBN0_BUGNE|nr:hypothetical protein EB796_006445 [Bugula neritina]
MGLTTSNDLSFRQDSRAHARSISSSYSRSACLRHIDRKSTHALLSPLNVGKGTLINFDFINVLPLESSEFSSLFKSGKG